jgi:hypothetical protein
VAGRDGRRLAGRWAVPSDPGHLLLHGGRAELAVLRHRAGRGRRGAAHPVQRGDVADTDPAGILAFALAGQFGWLGGPDPGPTEAQLLAEGTVDDERWAVVLVRTEKDETTHLRNRGVDVKVAELGTEQVLDRQHRRFVPGEYEIAVVTLPGTSRPLFFGLLPAGAVRAEVVPDPRKDAAIPIKIRAGDGTAVPYVIDPAPSSTAPWEDSVIVRVYDHQDQRLLPAKSK